MIDHIRDPKLRVRAALALLACTLVGWPTSHLMILVTKPPEASWVFHLLLALSWLALTLTCLNIVLTTDVRREQDQSS